MDFRISFSRPGKSWNLGVGHGKSWKMMFIEKYKINWVFFCEDNSENKPKMKNDFQENGQILVMENLEKSWKILWKVMEFEKLKRVRTLASYLLVNNANEQEFWGCDWFEI